MMWGLSIPAGEPNNSVPVNECIISSLAATIQHAVARSYHDKSLFFKLTVSMLLLNAQSGDRSAEPEPSTASDLPGQNSMGGPLLPRAPRSASVPEKHGVGCGEEWHAFLEKKKCECNGMMLIYTCQDN
jgi:hypothetical protein